MEKRDRLTVTLKKEVLNNLDKYIDGSRIRNRSHAVEYILEKHFSPKVKKAVILAGGRGLKMRPFTYEMPKAMIPINGRPVLEYIIENLRRNDIREIIVSIGYLGKKIEEYFSDGAKFGVKIKYLKQGKESGTVTPVLDAMKLVKDGPFLVYYGDVLSTIDLLDMGDFHLAGGAVATMAITSVKKSSDWGVVRMQGNRIYSYLEKPDSRKDLSHLINAGIYIFEPEIFKYLKPGMKKLEHEVLPLLVERKALNGYLFAGDWFDVGNPEIYKNAVQGWI
ncbi:MAG: nucleotidyltransferase family protein [Candidatus Falkowbacteria bacterium]